MTVRQETNGRAGVPGEKPEHELLLCCARARADTETAARIRELAGGRIDWEYLRALAGRHALLPLLYWQLNAAARDVVPAGRLARLRADYRENAARSLFLAGELEHVVGLLEGQGVAVVPYKGPALAACAYGNLTLRRFVDLDILVRKADVPRAKELLAARGYTLHPPLSEVQQSILLRTQHNLPLAREGGRVLVELHWVVAAERFASSVGAEDFWGRLGTLRLNRSELRSLSPEDLLIALCVHGSKHLWERLAWVCDVAELANSHPRLDWDVVVARAREAGNERMLFIGLRLATELLGARVPGDVRRVVGDDRAAAALAGGAAARLFDGRDPAPAGFARTLRFNLGARRNWGQKLSYLRHLLAPTDGDLVSVSLPARLAFVYYLLRPVRLALKMNAPH